MAEKEKGALKKNPGNSTRALSLLDKHMTTDYIPIPHYTFYCKTRSHCVAGAGLEPTLWPWEVLNLRYSSLTFLSSCDYSFASLSPAFEVNFYICNIITQRTAFPVVPIIQMSSLLLNPDPFLSGAVTSSCQWNGSWRPVIYSPGWIWPGIFAHWVHGTKPKDIPSPVLSLHLCCLYEYVASVIIVKRRNFASCHFSRYPLHPLSRLFE